MYFHLIWIKEKGWKQYEIDVLLNWWSENLIRDFLAHRWVVIVSLTEYKEDPKPFWNITMSVLYDNTEIQLLMPWEDLAERVYFVSFLWLAPQIANFVDNPIPDLQMKELIKSTFLKIKEENEKIKQEEEEEVLREQKKYEESNIKDWLRIINDNIDRIEQVIKAWQWVLSGQELKDLEDHLNDMKKIRLGTNFNKMATLVLDSHILVKKAEEQIFSTYDSQKFLIDKNSSVTNIDVLSDSFDTSRISEKAIFQPAWLTTNESIFHMLWSKGVFFKLLKHDILSTFESTSFEDFFTVVMNLIEYMVITATVVISLLWLFWPLVGYDKFSIYLLPAMWWLGLLLYMFNSLDIKKIIRKVVWFIVLAVIYWYGLLMLLWTFAL